MISFQVFKGLLRTLLSLPGGHGNRNFFHFFFGHVKKGLIAKPCSDRAMQLGKATHPATVPDDFLGAFFPRFLKIL